MAVRRLGFLHGGKREGRRSRWSRRGSLCSRGGARHEGAARGVHGGEEIVAAVSSLSPQEEDPDRWVPLSGYSPFLFPFLFPVAFRELIEAFKYFEKFWKNSQSLNILWGACDKICRPFAKSFMW